IYQMYHEFKARMTSLYDLENIENPLKQYENLEYNKSYPPQIIIENALFEEPILQYDNAHVRLKLFKVFSEYTFSLPRGDSNLTYIELKQLRSEDSKQKGNDDDADNDVNSIHNKTKI